MLYAPPPVKHQKKEYLLYILLNGTFSKLIGILINFQVMLYLLS